MDQRVLVVAAIILGAGVIGGWAAFLADDRAPEDGSPKWPKYLLLGVVAAASVPLFLSLVRSQLTQGMFDNTFNNEGRRFPVYYESYLVFAGICLIAAFSARKFIDSISRQVLQRLEEVRETAQGAAAAAAAAKEVAHDVANEVESADERAAAPLPPEVEIVVNDTADELSPPLLTVDEKSALRALLKKTYRTRSGVAEDAGISRNRISEVLEELHRKKLAVPTKSPTTGGARWIITKRGEAALNRG